MAINLIIAAIGAAGVFAAVLALGLTPRVPLSEMDRMVAGKYPEVSLGPLERLRQHLAQADLNVTVEEFLRVSLLLGLVLGLGAYLVTGAFLSALFGFLVGGLAYYTYLVERRDRRRQEYQKALIDVIESLIAGFRSGETLQAAFEEVARNGPAIARQDWETVGKRVQAGVPLDDALDELCQKRRDPILDMIAYTLVVLKREGGRLSEALGPLLESVRERVRIRERIKAEQQTPLWEIRLVAAIPFLATVILRATTEEFAAFWKTPLGQMMLLTSWTLAVVGLLIAQRYITNATRVEESFGVEEEIVELQETAPGLVGIGRPGGRQSRPGDVTGGVR